MVEKEKSEPTVDDVKEASFMKDMSSIQYAPVGHHESKNSIQDASGLFKIQEEQLERSLFNYSARKSSLKSNMLSRN